MAKHLILASSSPRRQELLKQVKIPYTLRKQDVDESAVALEDPKNTVKQLAILKGRNVNLESGNEVILSADTVVAFQNNIFGKPQSEEEAFQMLNAMNGRTHEVYTGVMLRSNEKETIFVEKTTVEFWELTVDELRRYIQTKEPFDKAGAYGIQSQGAILVKRIIGDYFNVVGLPLARTVRELEKYSIFPVS